MGREVTTRLRLPRVAVAWLLVPVLTGCGLSEYDPADDEFRGTAARDRIFQITRADPSALPSSATDFYLFDGGTFNGCIRYWTFTCANRDDCIAALKALTGVSKSELSAWSPATYAVSMQGPQYYFPQLVDVPWNVPQITDGLVLEIVQDDRRLEFHAIDLERNRVYFHRESGGFPTERFLQDGGAQTSPPLTR